jgi:hypothetical protein
MGRLLEVGSRDHKLRTTHIQRSLYDLVEVIVMSLFAMVHASKDRVAEVDTNLEKLSASFSRRRSRDLTHISVSKSLFFRHVAALGSCECSSLQLIGGLKRMNYGPAILGELTLPLKLSEMEKSNRDESLTYFTSEKTLCCDTSRRY